MSNGTTQTTSTGVTTPTAPADPLVGKQVGTESSLSNWAGPYVTEMLGRGMAMASEPYQAYTGPLTAGASDLQTQAFEGLAGLTIPTDQMTAYTPQSFTAEGVAQQYMNPYLMAALNPQLEEARRQAEISRIEQAGRLTRAGAYGGGRQAIMESELNRNLLQNLSGITGKGYSDAYNLAMGQFNTEEDRRRAATQAAQEYGLGVLARKADLGGVQRQIEQEGITADLKQFEEERDFPYKQVQYMQSLLSGLPLATQSYTYSQPSALSEALSGAGGVLELYEKIFGPTNPTTPEAGG
jgi:hypothetical protein